MLRGSAAARPRPSLPAHREAAPPYGARVSGEAKELSEAELDAAALDARETGRVVLRDVRLSQRELDRVLAELPHDGKARRAQSVDLTGVSFDGRCDVQDLVVEGPTSFSGARFDGGLDCDGARFEQELWCFRTVFGEFASFDSASFGAAARFMAAWFETDVVFTRATFLGEAIFSWSRFDATANFESGRFDGSVHLERVSVAQNLILSHASFRRARQLGPLRVRGLMSLDRSSFEEPVRIEVATDRLTCHESRFRAGVDLRARWADIAADGADFAGPSLITDLPADLTSPSRLLLGWERPSEGGGWEEFADPPSDYTPRVVSLRGAKVAELTLACVDLRACSFATAHGLDRLRLERGQLAQPPPPGLRLRHPWWTRRQTVAEEHQWRSHDYGSGWRSPEVTRATPAERPIEEPLPAQIAGIYRSLRKGREDGKDEPGAADFYYGEMEMRRHRADAPALERLTLTAYWLISGYGMRAGRALTALLLTIAVLAVPLDLGGFPDDRSYAGAVLYAVESSVSLLRAPEDHLTVGGQVVTIALRIVGPLLFGLAALALRSRVKR
jgi:uncharacterized protein YjbI with pentapeptide repeats